MAVDSVIVEDKNIEHDEFSQKCNLFIRHIFLFATSVMDFLVVVDFSFNYCSRKKIDCSFSQYPFRTEKKLRPRIGKAVAEI